MNSERSEKEPSPSAQQGDAHGMPRDEKDGLFISSAGALEKLRAKEW